MKKVDIAKYLIKSGLRIDCEFICTGEQIHQAVISANEALSKLPFNLYQSIDYKTASSIVGAMFREALANETGAIVNPIEKGHPDLIPESGKHSTEKELRNYPKGIEIKTTVGNVTQGSKLKPGASRIDYLCGITWQAHHREVKALLGLVWDFCITPEGKMPTITGAFYTDSLFPDDWGVISGTTGRNTKVTGMRASGITKMGKGWVVLLNQKNYIEKYEKFLGFNQSQLTLTNNEL